MIVSKTRVVNGETFTLYEGCPDGGYVNKSDAGRIADQIRLTNRLARVVNVKDRWHVYYL